MSYGDETDAPGELLETSLALLCNLVMAQDDPLSAARALLSTLGQNDLDASIAEQNAEDAQLLESLPPLSQANVNPRYEAADELREAALLGLSLPNIKHLTDWLRLASRPTTMAYCRRCAAHKWEGTDDWWFISFAERHRKNITVNPYSTGLCPACAKALDLWLRDAETG